MGTLGPLLAQSLARNIGGNASRSELDRLSEPVKRLVSRHPMAKEWLQSGLDHPSFPSDKVSPEQKALFVKKLIRCVFRWTRRPKHLHVMLTDLWMQSERVTSHKPGHPGVLAFCQGQQLRVYLLNQYSTRCALFDLRTRGVSYSSHFERRNGACFPRRDSG